MMRSLKHVKNVSSKSLLLFEVCRIRLARDFLPVQELTSRSGRVFTYFRANMAAPSGEGDTGKCRFHVQMMIFACFPDS